MSTKVGKISEEVHNTLLFNLNGVVLEGFHSKKAETKYVMYYDYAGYLESFFRCVYPPWKITVLPPPNYWEIQHIKEEIGEER